MYRLAKESRHGDSVDAATEGQHGTHVVVFQFPDVRVEAVLGHESPLRRFDDMEDERHSLEREGGGDV